MPGGIGPWDLAILLLVVLLVFGAKRVPEIGRSLGRGMREFADSISGKGETPTELENDPQQQDTLKARAPRELDSVN
jgi:sec-independent protein translocase protein TatA